MQRHETVAGCIPGSGRSPEGGHSNPLQCSCLENPIDRGAWQAAVHRVAKSQTLLKQLSTYTRTCLVYDANKRYLIDVQILAPLPGSSLDFPQCLGPQRSLSLCSSALPCSRDQRFPSFISSLFSVAVRFCAALSVVFIPYTHLPISEGERWGMGSAAGIQGRRRQDLPHPA